MGSSACLSERDHTSSSNCPDVTAITSKASSYVVASFKNNHETLEWTIALSQFSGYWREPQTCSQAHAVVWLVAVDTVEQHMCFCRVSLQAHQWWETSQWHTEAPELGDKMLGSQHRSCLSPACWPSSRHFTHLGSTFFIFNMKNLQTIPTAAFKANVLRLTPIFQRRYEMSSKGWWLWQAQTLLTKRLFSSHI